MYFITIWECFGCLAAWVECMWDESSLELPLKETDFVRVTTTSYSICSVFAFAFTTNDTYSMQNKQFFLAYTTTEHNLSSIYYVIAFLYRNIVVPVLCFAVNVYFLAILLGIVICLSLIMPTKM